MGYRVQHCGKGPHRGILLRFRVKGLGSEVIVLQ